MWSPEDLGSPTSLAVPSPVPVACLIGPGWLHSTPATARSRHPTILSLPVSQDFHCSQGCTFTSGLFQPLMMLSLRISMTPQSWSFHCNPVHTVTNGLCWCLFRETAPATQCQASAALPDTLMSSKRGPYGETLTHCLPSFAPRLMRTQPHSHLLWTIASVC